MGLLSLWILALLPGLVHLIVLHIYFVRYDVRKVALQDLIDKRREGGSGRLAATRNQIAEWRSRLDLNRRSYQLPALLSALLASAAGVVLVSNNSQNDLGLPAPIISLIRGIQPAPVAGFVGAYIWGMYDFVDRFRILNLSPAALHRGWFRLLLGPILGFYIQFLVKDNIAPFIAFALGTIPVPDIAKWIRDKATTTLSLSAARGADPGWDSLEGVTDDIISRLLEADVSSVSHLGNQDPINLLRRTNIEWRNVLDMMDQAYLWGYLEKDLPKLRKRGIRGAIEMAIVHQRLQDPDTHDEALALVQGIALDLSTNEASVQNLAQNLFEDPQVDLIWTLWYERDHGGDGEELTAAAATSGFSGT